MPAIAEKQSRKVDPNCGLAPFAAAVVAVGQQSRFRSGERFSLFRAGSSVQLRARLVGHNGQCRRSPSESLSGLPAIFHFHLGESQVSIRFLSIAATVVLGTAAGASALAAQTTARPAAQAPRPAAPAANRQAPPTRAAMQQSLDTNFKTIDTNGDGALN